jgi:hypothetical protein
MVAETSAAYKKKQSKGPEGRFSAGDMARFSGKAADGTISGDLDVKVVNPWSNKDKVTHTDKSGRAYEGANAHIPTASVERPESKGAFPRPAKQFEAYHHTLSKL